MNLSTRRKIDVAVHGRHVDILIGGKVFAHSEDYATEAKARRAADTFVEAVNTREMRLIYWLRNERVVKTVRKLWTRANGLLVALPAGARVDEMFGGASGMIVRTTPLPGPQPAKKVRN